MPGAGRVHETSAPQIRLWPLTRRHSARPRCTAVVCGYLNGVSYLIVDAADDAILAECDSPAAVLWILRDVQKEKPQREVRVMLFSEHHGELVGTQTLASARVLSDREAFALYGRRRRKRRGARRVASHDRP